MVRIVWEFLVRAHRLPEFERHYSGVGGSWAQLFSKSPGFRGTVLLRNTQDPRHFLTIDSWDSVVAQLRIREQFHDEYSRLDQACEELTESERRVGVFEDSPPRDGNSEVSEEVDTHECCCNSLRLVESAMIGAAL
jgi:heme-degrading monooxygenase HmoA